MHDTKRRVAGGDESGFLRQLATRARQRILAIVECTGRHLPGRLIPRVAPLPHEHRVRVVEIGDDERRVGVGDHGVGGLGTVRKPDHVLADYEGSGPARDPGLRHLERPAACGMRKLAQVLMAALLGAARDAVTRWFRWEEPTSTAASAFVDA